MSTFGAQAYQKVSVDTGVSTSNPHELVLMLYDGAIAAVRVAFGHMKAGRIADKGAAIGKATSIIDQGLKVSLDMSAGGQLAFRLADLYDYMTMRLLQANLRNDTAALAEVGKLLTDLRGAWAQIGQSAATGRAPAATDKSAVGAVSAPPAEAPAAAQGSAAKPTNHFFDGGDHGPVRRLVISA